MLESLIILVLILANGVLALAEIAIVSARKARLKQFADEGSARAQDAIELGNEPGQFLATVQIGITLVGILAGAVGGAALSVPLAALLQQIVFVAPYADQIAFVVVVIVITYLSLVIGELVPKRIALTNPEQYAIAVARPMRVLSRVAAPVVRLLSFSTETVLRVLNVSLTQDQSVTEEEVKNMIDEGTATGVFEPTEREIVKRVFRLGDLVVNALMTPRTEIATIDIQDSEKTIRRKLTLHDHSRFPVIRGTVDTIMGIVATQDLMEQTLQGKTINVALAMKPALFIPEGMSAFDLLEKFKTERTHQAIVTDEYGSVSGMITINDLVEAIVGEIPVTGDGNEPEVVQRQDGSFLVDGKLPTHEFKEKFEIKALPDEDEGYYQTVGGFVMTMLGRVPTAGDVYEWDVWRVEVMDMDGRRVDKVLLTRAQTPKTDL